MNNARLSYLREKARSLPTEPGVYLMQDTAHERIYIGKAKSLRNRVSSYFMSVENHLPKVYAMVEKVYDFDYIVTDSEFEALILECSMIKLYQPKYNILLKDDKGYNYIRIAPGAYPRITAEKQKQEDGAVYIGPYISSFVVKQTVEQTNKAFLLPTCGRQFPADFRKARPCLNYHIKQCMGVCRGNISAAEYDGVIREAIAFMKGGSEASVQRLTQKMEDAAAQMDFERAASYRDQIRAIQKITDKQKVIYRTTDNQDVIAFAADETRYAASVLKFREQRLCDKQDFLLGECEAEDMLRRDFLLQYYSDPADVPPLITLDGACAEAELVAQYLTSLRQKKVELHIPQKGEQKQLVDMAKNNAAQQFSLHLGRSGRELIALEELGRVLGLGKTPSYIEAYDISNIGADTVVGAMVVFEHARPLKAAYKKFKMKTVLGTDDYASMAEMLTRRLSHYAEEQESGTGFGRLPDLILVDGGKGHTAIAAQTIREMGFSIPVFGMVKDEKHRTRAIAADDREIMISNTKRVFSLVTAIQDEVHRSAIGYARTKHGKRNLQTALQEVDGIGPAKAKALFDHFHTRKAMYAASPETLASVKGITPKTAQALYDFLHSDR